MKKFLKISLLVIVIGGIIAALSFVNSRRSAVACNEINIMIDTSGGVDFLEEEEIRSRVQDYCTGDSAGVNVRAVEEEIRGIAVVKNCEVYMDLNQVINVRITQRKPLARLMFQGEDNLYIDTEGKLMPTVTGHPVRVLAVNGNLPNSAAIEQKIIGIDSTENPSVLENIFAVVKAIEADPFWKANIEQIYRDEKGNFVLIPKVGDHEILAGEALHIEGKLEKLKIFYQTAMTRKGWNEYKILDIRFKGQVIAKRLTEISSLQQDSLIIQNE